MEFCHNACRNSIQHQANPAGIVNLPEFRSRRSSSLVALAQKPLFAGQESLFVMMKVSATEILEFVPGILIVKNPVSSVSEAMLQDAIAR
jgi:hypothetical protein